MPEMKKFTVPKSAIRKSLAIGKSEVKRLEKAIKEADGKAKTKLKAELAEGKKFMAATKKLL